MAVAKKTHSSKSRAYGRPSVYTADVHDEQGYRFALLGATDQQMADCWNISKATLHEWKIKYPTFLKRLNEGREPADSAVAASLNKRAHGFYQQVEKVVIVNGKPKTVKYNEYFPPSDTAGIFWLKNRQRDKWRDIQRQELTGKDGDAIKTEATQTVILDASKMEPGARELLREALKAAKG